ncbi:MAG: stage II sporulation protein P [Oscillospiraceae bacterium]
MKRGRSKRRKRINYSNLLLIILIAAFLPVSVIIFKIAAPTVSEFGERLVLFSAMTALPNQSAGLLEEHYNSEVFAPEEIDEPQVEPALPESAATPTIIPIRPVVNKAAPIIPTEYRGKLDEQLMVGKENSYFVKTGKGYLRNYTELSSELIEKILTKGCNIKGNKTKEPQVLIFHTHATESYEPYDNIFYDKRGTWRSTDNNQNMVAVGDALAAALEAKGIAVIHNDTQHDYPSYNGSYDRSAKTVASYLEKYPSIKIVLDVHRDATQTDDVIIKPTAMINGKKAAQVMIIAPCDDGTMNIPNWKENLNFAAALQNSIENRYSGLTRPIFFCYRKYNMHLSTGALLLEVGSHGNTLEEAVYTASMVGECLGDYLLNTSQ